MKDDSRGAGIVSNYKQMILIFFNILNYDSKGSASKISGGLSRTRHFSC